MKKASSIISLLQGQPQFGAMKKQHCYRKFIQLLNPKWQKAVLFVYLRNETLFVAVSHPAFKMELNYNRDLLKSLLAKVAQFVPECNMLCAKEVVVFVSKLAAEPSTVTSTVPYYQERSSDDISYDHNSPFASIFEKIQQHIKKNAAQ